MYKLITPVELPADTVAVEVDQFPAADGSTVKQLRFIFHKTDGTKVVKKGNLGTLTEAGLTITLA